MISPLRHFKKIPPQVPQTPEDDLCELSWQLNNQESPQNEYKTPLDCGRRKSTSVEGWFKP